MGQVISKIMSSNIDKDKCFIYEHNGHKEFHYADVVIVDKRNWRKATDEEIAQYTSKAFRATIRCPFCRGEMIWQSDAMSEEVGYEVEGKIVTYYTCSHCGAEGEFVEKLTDDSE